MLECLCIIFHNENTTEGMTEALKYIHTNVPKWSPAPDEDKTFFSDVGLAGDQLSVERAANCLLSLSSGFTAKERLDGIHVEIETGTLI